MNISKIKLKEVLIEKISEKAQLDKKSSDIIIDHYLTAEMAGIKSHGILKLLWDMNLFVNAVKAKPEILQNKNGELFVNMNGMIGALGIDWLVAQVKKYDLHSIHYQNLLPYGALFSVAYKLIEKTGKSAFILNNTDKFMSTEGGHDLIGTNPFCMALASDPPIIFDMATSKRSMSIAFQAKEQPKSLDNFLPKDTFLDSEKHFTQTPSNVKYVAPFGEYKGYGLGFMIELFTQFMFTQKQSSLLSNTFLSNGIILTMNTSTYDKFEFRKYISNLKDRYPGQIAMNTLIDNLSKKDLEIEENTSKRLGLDSLN